MNNEGKVKISSILLSVLVIVAIVLIVFICFEYSKRNQNEKAVKEVVSQIESITPNEEKTELPYIEYEGYQIIGTIKIPKIDIEYPILVESTKDSLEKSITRVGNGKVNEVGNLSMAGHNYLDGTMFGKIDELQNDDEIIIKDLLGNEVNYKVFDIFVTNPNDVGVLESVDKEAKEITLITCTNGNKNRLIVKARENVK